MTAGGIGGLRIREATLADVPAITAIHCADSVRWRRWDAEGREHFARYADLSTYERWLNGGPWMDETTCARHIAALLTGAGLALVAESDGRVVAEAEGFIGAEPPPYGQNFNLSVLYVHRDSQNRGLGSALMRDLLSRAQAEGCDTFVVSHAEATGFYAKHGLAHRATWRKAKLPAQPRNTRYAAERVSAWHSYETVRGWAMPVGRYQSARQEWERGRPGMEPDFPEWADLRRETWRLTVRGKPALLTLDESPQTPGWADAHLWTPSALTRQHLSAMRDLAARSGFAGLFAFVAADTLPRLGPVEMDDYRQQVWLRDLSNARADGIITREVPMPIRLEALTRPENQFIAMRGDAVVGEAIAALQAHQGRAWWHLLVQKQDGTWGAASFQQIYTEVVSNLDAPEIPLESLSSLVTVEAIEAEALSTGAAEQLARKSLGRMVVVTEQGAMKGILFEGGTRSSESTPLKAAQLTQLAGKYAQFDAAIEKKIVGKPIRLEEKK